ncbi:unnamed protein product [Paramecium sonneborni]|uniref:Uncharacterized protein n=1 Tax=Paramecium sonneborni TaxID=65129 RepID=A0A8S1KGG0_9CILI|nr:unnamed protein product [Paramecium sonneborni]
MNNKKKLCIINFYLEDGVKPYHFKNFCLLNKCKSILNLLNLML